jgi:nucleotide-binding universal stress UspA family protein
MTPVDLAHADRLDKALSVAADLSRHWGAPVTYVGVTAATPSAIAHTPAEYAKKLEAFVQGEVEKHGHEATARAMVSHDPTTDLDDTLLKAVGETGADLVVMASHIPGVMDYVWPSNGGKLAEHSDASVLVVRAG